MKYKISLGDNYNLPGPFVTDWNLELIGDKLRAEFETYLDDYKKQIKYVEGSSKTLIIPLILQRFMNLKKITLVEDPSTGGLVSRFVLMKGETKEIDERAANALHVFKRREVINKEGEFENWIGFMNIEPIGKPAAKANAPITTNVVGDSIDYFEVEEAVEEEPEKRELIPGTKEHREEYPNLKNIKLTAKSVQSETKVSITDDVPEFYCDKCKKKFSNKGIYTVHMNRHKREIGN